MICLGIDIGTQSLKVVVTENASKRLGQASVAYGARFPQPGWAEQDPALWLKALAAALPEALRKASVKASDLAAVGIAAQLDGCVAVDEQNRALGPCLIWMDRRSSLPTMPEDFRARTGLVADASHMAAKIRHLRQRGVQAARFHQPASFVVESLCGAAVMDHALASTTMLYDLASRDYDPDLLRLFDLSRDCLPGIAAAESIAGVVSAEAAEAFGLCAGVPVAVGTGDDFATTLGAGVAAPGAMVCILGTAEVVGTVSAEPLIDETGLVETHGYLSQYFIENPGWLSGGAVVWCRELLGVASDAEFDDLAARAPVGCDGLNFVPALAGAMSPSWHAGARACFYGLSASHGQAHMARAVLEGCAFAMHDVRSRLLQMGLMVDPILLLGGGAHSGLWAQMRADVSGVSVHAHPEEYVCALGASLLARAAVDPSRSLVELAATLRPASRVFEPNAAQARGYQDAYRRYRELFAAIRPLF